MHPQIVILDSSVRPNARQFQSQHGKSRRKPEDIPPPEFSCLTHVRKKPDRQGRQPVVAMHVSFDTRSPIEAGIPNDASIKPFYPNETPVLGQNLTIPSRRGKGQRHMSKTPNQFGNSAMGRLTARQRECLSGVAEYLTYKEIGRRLGISDSMVEKHLRVARERLGVTSNAEAARLFLSGEGEAEPQVGFVNLVGQSILPDNDLVPQVVTSDQVSHVEDIPPEASSNDNLLSPLQTLRLIGSIVLFSIIGLLLLIACAQAIKVLVGG